MQQACSRDRILPEGIAEPQTAARGLLLELFTTELDRTSPQVLRCQAQHLGVTSDDSRIAKRL